MQRCISAHIPLSGFLSFDSANNISAISYNVILRRFTRISGFKSKYFLKKAVGPDNSGVPSVGIVQGFISQSRKALRCGGPDEYPGTDRHRPDQDRGKENPGWFEEVRAKWNILLLLILASFSLSRHYHPLPVWAQYVLSRSGPGQGYRY
jgi:hypothetical protein